MNQEITIDIRSYDKQTTELYNSNHTESNTINDFVHSQLAQRSEITSII